MELDWSTFLLEIVNFLILVWILKRFFYRPILDVIAARKGKIEAILNDAKEIREEAGSLKAVNEKKYEEWETRRQSLESALSAEIASKREKMLADLNVTLEKEKARQAALSEREAGQLRLAMEDQALLLGAGFSSSLLSRLASPELEMRLFEAFMEDLEKYDAAKMRLETEKKLDVSSAYPLPEEQKRLLVGKMESLLGRPLEPAFSENPDLLCGIRVRIGPWVLHANLKDELAYFRGAFRNAG